MRQERKDVRERLSAYRRERASLGTDDKILTGWNGLMIAALARSAVIMERPQFLKAAQRAEGFLWEHIHMGNGLIMARWRQGEAKYPGILDDYAFFIWGLLECYGACYDAEYLEKAELLGERMLEQSGQLGGLSACRKPFIPQGMDSFYMYCRRNGGASGSASGKNRSGMKKCRL